MDIGEKKMLDVSLPSPQMNKLQILSTCKLFSHYLPRMVLQFSQKSQDAVALFIPMLVSLSLGENSQGNISPCTNQILIHCPFVCGKSIVDTVPPIYQKTFLALYVICKST
jgi:hypothetical protein